MSHAPERTLIYHITDVANLQGILDDGGLNADAVMATRNPTIIGYDHIKQRRLKEISVECCGNRFVGEFVPFYFCPRSPMLFTINLGKTGRPPGCQNNILHLVACVAFGASLGREWAISDGNAGAFHTSFYSTLEALEALDWTAIRATDWRGKTHQKSAEFLVADFFPWLGVTKIVCHNSAVRARVQELIRNQQHQPVVEANKNWYY
jgi:hypothetical protein